MRMKILKNKIFYVCTAICVLACLLIGCSDANVGVEKPPLKEDSFEMSSIDGIDVALADFYSYEKKAEGVFSSISPTDAAELIYTDIDGGVRIDGYSGDGEMLVIPSSINGKHVIEIAEHAFCSDDDTASSGERLRSIYVPDSVVKIGFGAFCDCDRLQLLRLPFIGSGDGETYIGHVFGADSYESQAVHIPVSLEMMIIGAGEENVAPYAFCGVKSLDAICLEGARRIGEFAFYECSELCYVGLPEGLLSIGEYAFSSCSSLARIDLDGGLESIGFGAFYLCSSMTEMMLPFVGNGADVTHIGYVFGAEVADWNEDFVPRSLLRVNITGACESIDNKAFAGCRYIACVNLSEGLRSIGIRAFSGCRSLRELVTPSSLEQICDDAFFGCDGLKRVEIKGQTRIGRQAFFGCDGIEEKIISDKAVISDSAF